MKTLKRATFGTFMIASALMIALGGYNSALVDETAFLRNDFGIKLAKRLDEIKGEIIVGRMAASIPTWNQSSTKLIKKQAEQLIKNEITPKKISKKKKIAQIDKAIPAPVVNDDLELSLSGGFYDKKALTDASQFSGSAVVQDGVIEAINVSLPGGQVLSINTNERMVGNVFQYEDTGTRERKSGLFYKVKPGVFMVTLTDDTQFPGLRLEFKTNESAEIAENNNLDVDYQDNQPQELEQAQNNQEVDFYQEAATQEQAPVEQPAENTSYGFNFGV